MTLWDIPAARTTDPETSHRAAASVRNIRESQQTILNLLKEHGALSDEQIFKKFPKKITPSGARTRRNELVRMGLVKDSGQTDKTASGRATIIWQAIEGAK